MTITQKFISLQVEPDETILTVKAKIENQEGIPLEQQILKHSYKELKNEYTLSQYNIYND